MEDTSRDLIKVEWAVQGRDEAPTLTARQKPVVGCLVPGVAAYTGKRGPSLRNSLLTNTYVSWEGPRRSPDHFATAKDNALDDSQLHMSAGDLTL